MGGRPPPEPLPGASDAAANEPEAAGIADLALYGMLDLFLGAVRITGCLESTHGQE
jgi:hypothetical protein